MIHGAFCVYESSNIVKKCIKPDSFQFILGLFHKLTTQLNIVEQLSHFRTWKQIEVQNHLSLSSKSFV